MLKTGDHAPDAELNLSDGSIRRLSGYWQAQPVALVFIRHLG